MSEHFNREEMLEQIAHVMLAGRLVVLCGSDQDLLTSSLGQLAMELIEHGEIVRLDALTCHQADEVRSSLSANLQISDSELGAVLRLRADGRNPLLAIVDNAECLSAQALGAMAELSSVAAGGLGVVLAGEHDLLDLLDEQGVLAEFVFDLDESGAQLMDADNEDDEALVLPWKHISAVLGLLILIWLLWPAAQNGPSDSVQALELPEPVVMAKEVIEPDHYPLATEFNRGVMSEEQAQDLSQEQSTAAMLIDAYGEAPLADQVVDGPASALDQSVADSVQVDEVDLSESVLQTAQEPLSESGGSEVVSADVASAVVADNESEKSPLPKAAEPLTGLQAELGYRQEDWLLVQAPGQWVIQLAATSSEDSARRLLDQLGVERGAYYRTKRNDKVVYLALAVIWPDRDSAAQARDRLPKTLLEKGPFPRELSQIQEEIRKAL